MPEEWSEYRLYLWAYSHLMQDQAIEVGDFPTTWSARQLFLIAQALFDAREGTGPRIEREVEELIDEAMGE